MKATDDGPINAIGLRIANVLLEKKCFKVRNMVDILNSLPSGTNLIGIRIDNTYDTAYLFFENKDKFPEVKEGEQIPLLNPQFKKSGKKIKLTDIGYPEDWNIKC